MSEFTAVDPVTFGAIVVPTLVGLVQVAKEAGMPARFSPLLAIGLGILGGMTLIHLQHSTDWWSGALIGIGFGLSAIGLFESAAGVGWSITGKRPADATETQKTGPPGASGPTPIS